MKVKCEICGEMIEQKDMSKSYKHRCKKCVAELTKLSRNAAKQNDGHIPVGEVTKSATSTSEKSTLLNMATVFMQGMLGNANICNPRCMNAEAVVALARNAMTCAKALIMVFEKECID